MGEGSFGKVFLVRNIHTRTAFSLIHRSRIRNEEVLILPPQKKRQRPQSPAIHPHTSKPEPQMYFLPQSQGILKFINYIITKDDSIYLLFEACKKGSLEGIKNILLKSK